MVIAVRKTTYFVFCSRLWVRLFIYQNSNKTNVITFIYITTDIFIGNLEKVIIILIIGWIPATNIFYVNIYTSQFYNPKRVASSSLKSFGL